MHLNVEMNIVFFPLDEAYDKKTRSISSKEEDDKKVINLTPEQKAVFRAQRSEVHLIKIGPITEEFLTLKKLNPALDFLEGVKFTLTDDNDYLWTSSGEEELKGLPIHSQHQVLAALGRMGYTDLDNNQLPYPFDQQSNTLLSKYFYILSKKF